MLVLSKIKIRGKQLLNLRNHFFIETNGCRIKSLFRIKLNNDVNMNIEYCTSSFDRELLR